MVFGGPFDHVPYTVFPLCEERIGCQGLSDELQSCCALSPSHNA